MNKSSADVLALHHVPIYQLPVSGNLALVSGNLELVSGNLKLDTMEHATPRVPKHRAS